MNNNQNRKNRKDKRLRKKMRKLRKLKQGPRNRRRSRAPRQVNSAYKKDKAILAPSSMGQVLTNTNPMRTLRIRNREYVRSIGTTANSVTSVLTAINAGLSVAFPWLCKIAQFFQTYSFKKLDYSYVPTTSTATAGSVTMAPDYNAATEPPTEKSSLMAFQDAVTGQLWTPVECRFTPSNLKKYKRYFVRTDALGVNQDVKTYDVANLQLLTDGAANTEETGGLWVDYDVELQTPQFDTGLLDVFVYDLPLPSTYLKTGSTAMHRNYFLKPDDTLVNLNNISTWPTGASGVSSNLIQAADYTTIKVARTSYWYYSHQGDNSSTALTGITGLYSAQGATFNNYVINWSLETANYLSNHIALIAVDTEITGGFPVEIQLTWTTTATNLVPYVSWLGIVMIQIEKQLYDLLNTVLSVSPIVKRMSKHSVKGKPDPKVSEFLKYAKAMEEVHSWKEQHHQAETPKSK